MYKSLLPRRASSLLSSAATASRFTPSWTSRTSLQAPHSSSSPTPTRPFSHTSIALSSPFRLSSNNANTTDHPSADGEYYSPYKPKRQWPPDMSKLSPKHQFRLERKYRRRAALKFARPKWTKATKLIQWTAIGFVLIYALLFMEWDERGSPFDEIRRTFFTGVKDAFSTPAPPRPVTKSDDSRKE
ncbi:hypothetical protein BDV59DRAFT_60835 [Aspergillus ambiguus]|uniref:uncharacterized protein n=1 Tax=Aspergillus ambiguus TaxID=176160 RepID=UPI003CCE0C44